MWEYNKFTFNHCSESDLLNELNKIGEDNWEIIFYHEEKPPMFDGKWISTVLVKRLKTSMSK